MNTSTTTPKITNLKKFIHGALDESEKRFLRAWYKRQNNWPINTTEKNLKMYCFCSTNQQLYYLLVEEWNQSVDRIKSNIKKHRKQKEEAEDTTEKTFIIHMKIRTLYKKDWYENNELIISAGTIKHSDLSSNVQKAIHTKKFADNYIEHEINMEDNYKTITVLDYKIENMNTTEIQSTLTPKIKQAMKRSFVLRNDWLQFSHGIAEYAYDETEGHCVYHQLSKFLIEPPTGNPSKFINKQKTSEESLCNFFSNFVTENALDNDYQQFDMDYGVSTEMIAALCKQIGRNMYAYDENSKVFHSVTEFASKNYCPIVFYKLHGHCYLIDEPSVFRSVAESNKKLGNKIISSTIEDKVDSEAQEVTHLPAFIVSEAKAMKEGLYLVKQGNLDREIIEFYRLHRQYCEPQTKTRNTNVIQIKFQEGFVSIVDKKQRKYVTICVDATTGERYDYNQIKAVADINNIQYTNEGFGSLVLSVLKNNKRHPRDYLNDTEKKEFFETHSNQCFVCNLPCDNLEIDHIIPLAAGGSNELSNLQPLCKDCHKTKTTLEKESGAYKSKDLEGSIFNKVTLDHMTNSNEFKSWAFIERVPITGPIENVFRYDLNKCRRNNAYFSEFEFPVYSVMDIPRPFSGLIRCGMYLVETCNTYPFRGIGWYTQPLVQYALDNNIIDLANIKGECIPSNKLPKDYFQKPIDVLLKAFESDPDLQKLAPNTLVGLFGRTKSTASRTKFTACPMEASTWWGESDPRCDVFIRSIQLDENNKLYEGIFNETVQVESTKYPLYKQILELEAIELHKLETLLIKKGAVILDRKTDAVGYSSKKEIEIQEYWDDNKTIQKYKKEPNSKILETEVLPRMRRDTKIDMSVFELEWNIQYDFEGSVEAKAREIIQSNVSYHIDGSAGTGKSYLTNSIIKELENQGIERWKRPSKLPKGEKKVTTSGKYFMAFAPTNKGARIIGGDTIHSVYFSYQSSKKKLFEMLENVEYIFIDEVSMMIKEFYQLFTLIKRSFKNIKFIIAGDFNQLPPVCDEWEGDYENSPAMNLLCEGNRIKLTICRRSDDALFKLCQDAKNVNKFQFQPKQKTFLNLAYTHRTRKTVNNECMERFIDKNQCDTISVDCDKLNPKTQDVKLAVGMPVIAHKTNKKLRFLNSQTFTIESVTNESLCIKSDDTDITIKTVDFHKFFYLGFCLTIHASQGETFDTPYTIYDWYKLCPKSKYVALSRGTKLENIQIA